MRVVMRVTTTVRAALGVLGRRSAVRLAAAGGQTTAEYALVILGAAALGTLLIAWATNSHAVSKLFDEVVGKILP